MLGNIATKVAEVAVQAADTDTALDTFLTSIKSGLADFSTGNLGKVLLAGIGVAAPLFLAWFGYRFVKRRATSAVTKGKL